MVYNWSGRSKTRRRREIKQAAQLTGDGFGRKFWVKHDAAG